ncbi:MAG: hypothetical protein UW13_C0003G0109 [candidate division WWE3 bacterium GW2011_GWA1_43_94]|nr:MAG: hypothetical protein UU91_C0010G0008 [candidate division WWE3 bacterium GW2011_GWB1_42_117]KKS55095.1 MAG: hypothetical protein UV21_C0003G0109 [candidate division WWE3 bacterium GW2011_GWD2_42_34]KKT10255.1 MAG: hypothetical protein UV90_C0007G0020 [candidate division WWE3 bacterium GW2011_GWA2_43_24]KKT27522.1 MAG: hypothetical protein UW13_C0003G0109 [candidate division WWE3 bacterium GW2011_GWA1_43_94]KKT64528.1 MAG: hypothetical protein UW59_C0009G0008 [candidate division WWE3 bact
MCVECASTMKILKKVALVTFLIFLIVGLVFLLFTYFIDNGSLSLGLSDLTSQEDNSSDQSTAFSVYTNSYVMDPDLGAVTGTSQKNQAAIEFQEWLRKRWVSNENPAEPVDTKYDFFVITGLNNGSVDVRTGEDQEMGSVSLRCLPEDTALFKSHNMEFVSANFDINREVKLGDTLYTECTSELCEATSSTCVLVRRP